MKKFLLSILLLIYINPYAFAEYNQALELFNEKKYKESLDILGQDLIVADDYKSDSPNYKIRFLAAHNHWKLGNIESASAHFRRCMAIDKSKVDPYIDISIMYVEKGRLNEAISVIEDGLKIKEDPMLFWVLGRVHYKKGNYLRAKELLERANSIEPDFYFSYNDLGIVLMKLRKFGDANAAFTVALAIQPDSAEINYNIAQSLLMLGKNNEALDYAKRALELDSDNESIKNLNKRIEEIKNN
ncbi:MAG: tetratricopeptide repeat protein [Leptospirales bacterium]|nr:tetratricopeptide repeat protein [Leptospirales bacterium]